MIEARPLHGFDATFGRYLQWLLRRSFRGVWVREDATVPDGGFIAVANHTSWWDGFLPYAAQRAIAPTVPFFVMMTEEQLRRYWFFRYGGAFSIDAGSPRDCVRSIDFAARSASGGGGVWIYPQGRLENGDPERFYPGYLHAARAAGKPVVACAVRLAFVEAQRPDAFVEFAAPIDPCDRDAGSTVLAAVRASLQRIDRDLAAGRALHGRRPLYSPSGGPDVVSARLAAIAGNRFVR
jgi:1-acyl-sn-glycerol-3-phosphate acyltransferase